ncbi:MAG: fibronectin type III domain-containing protein [Pseudomonadota bacterium]|nr:fibronectin type III domain-containing protein [Pseudomonadota bacterium]
MPLPLFLLVPLLACHTIEKIGLDTAPPANLCGGEIFVPLAGYDDSSPDLADAHAARFGADPEPYHVHLSWADDPSTTMALIWRTDADTTATQVQYGLDTDYGSTGNGASFFVGVDQANGRVHEAHLCELTPGTTYHYRVGGEGHWSADATFTTAPNPGEAAPFRFAVTGDSRDNQATWGLLLDAMESHAPDFYLFSGDAVDLGVNMSEWDAWFAAGEGHLDHRPLVFAHGNHEFQVQNYYALVAQPGNEQWFSLDYADAHFVVLNDTVATAGDRELQAAWMEADLAATEAKWRIALHHMPAYSSCTTHGSNVDLQTLWSPIEEAGGVVLDLTGHNHNYERSYPLLDGAQTTAELGTTYVVAAGAGAVLYGNDLSNAFTEVAAVTENFVIVDVADGTLTLTAYDLGGNVLDRFVTTR